MTGLSQTWVSSVLPGVPASVNDLPLDSRNPRYRRARDAWMADVALLMMERGNTLPKRLGVVVASAILTFPQRRRRDAGNYGCLLDKFLGDLLQNTGRLPDDTPEYYRFAPPTIVVGEHAGTVLLVRYELAEAVA